MNYAIWFNGNNWESREFVEAVDAALFVERFQAAKETQGYTWFVTNEMGRYILIDSGAVSL